MEKTKSPTEGFPLDTAQRLQVVKGTVNPDGPFSRGLQKGAAYVFRRSATTGRWYEESKLFLDDGQGTDRYGWQVRRLIAESLENQCCEVLAGNRNAKRIFSNCCNVLNYLITFR